MHVYAYIYIRIYICIYVCMYVCICMCVCMYCTYFDLMTHIRTEYLRWFIHFKIDTDSGWRDIKVGFSEFIMEIRQACALIASEVSRTSPTVKFNFQFCDELFSF